MDTTALDPTFDVPNNKFPDQKLVMKVNGIEKA